MLCRLLKLPFKLESAAVMRSTFSSRVRAVAIRRGISLLESPRSTVRSEPGGSGGSLSTPLKARILVSPTTPFSIVKMLEVRSHLASLEGTSMLMRTLPLSSRSMRLTRPTGKPEKVKSMPTRMPSESSASSTRDWVFSKTPRATIT